MRQTMDEAKLRGALGLSRRAGKCLTGDFAVEKAVKAGKVRLVALDSLASDATRERYVSLCERKGIPCILIAGMGQAVGKPDGRIAAVTDEGFAHMILSVYMHKDDMEH